MSPQIFINSIFVCDGGIKEENIIPEEMKELWEKTKTIIRHVSSIMIDCGMNISIENYLQRFNTSYMTFTYNLACGVEFSKLIYEIQITLKDL